MKMNNKILSTHIRCNLKKYNRFQLKEANSKMSIETTTIEYL